MATNKQTMDVIAMGLFPGNAKAEEREDVICPVIEQIAQRAAEDFTDMAIELDMQGTLEMVNYLEAAQSFGSGREVVTLMKCIFLASGRKEAAKTLEFLDACYKQDELAYEYFTECFLKKNSAPHVQSMYISMAEKGFTRRTGPEAHPPDPYTDPQLSAGS